MWQYLLIGWYTLSKRIFSNRLAVLIFTGVVVALAASGTIASILANDGRYSTEYAANQPLVHPPNLVRGGKLKVILPTVAAHMDPHQSVSDAVLTWGAGLVYSRLFRFQTGATAVADRDITKIECDLCAKWRQRSPTEFEVVLREDIVWQAVTPLNGRGLTVDDLIASYERQSTLLNGELLKNFESFTKQNQTTLLIKLKTPDPEALQKLAHAGSSIVPPELYAGSGGALLTGVPVGTGPWILDADTADNPDITRFTANPNYFESQLPYLDTLEFTYSNDPVTRVAAIEVRDLFGRGLAAVDVTLGNADLTRAVDPLGAPLNLVRQPAYSNGVEIVINTTAEPLSDPNLRRALLAAWDITGWVREIWGSEYAPGLGLSPPSVRSETQSAALLQTAFNSITDDQKTLLTTGFNNRTVDIKVGRFSERHLELAIRMADALRAFTPVTITPLNTYEYATRITFAERPGDELQIAVGLAAPTAFLGDKLLSVYHTVGPANTSGYGTPQLDELIEQLGTEYDPSKREQLYAQVTAAIVRGAHRFHATTDLNFWLTKTEVQNFTPRLAGANNFFLTQVWKN